MFLKRLFSFIPKNEFSKALNLYNAGQYRKALQKFQELQKAAENTDEVDQSTLDLYTCEAHVALSKEFAAEGDIAAAITEMEAAAALKPMFADLHYMLGTFHAQSDNYEAACESFKSSLTANNKFFRARIHLSLALRACGRHEEATSELESGRHSCPNLYRESLDELMKAMSRQEDDESVEALYNVLLEERPSSAKLSKELAIEAIQNGDDEEAIRELKKAIAVKPDYPDLHNYLGIAYGNAGMVDEAVEEFEVALKINPYYLKARVNLALLFYENDRYEESRTQLDEVLAVQPDNQLANNLMEELRALADGN